MKQYALFLSFALYAANSLMFASQSIDLSGQWRFAIDASDTGLHQQWYKSRLPGDETLYLPGSMQAQGFGYAPGPSTPWVGDIRQAEWNKPQYAPYRSANNFKMPFWLQPDKYYKGAAWYQKTVNIPPSWKDKHLTLTLERPHWQTQVWVDGTYAGSVDHLSVPHSYELSQYLTTGQHTLTIRMDNGMMINVGPNSHSISDHTQSNWNGIVGQIELKAESSECIDGIQVYPDLKSSSIKVVTQLSSLKDHEVPVQLVYEVSIDGRKAGEHKTKVKLLPSGISNQAVIPITGPIEKWDEFNPCLYTLKARLEKGGDTVDEHICTFGMRQIRVQGNRIMLNDRPAFLRGTLECCIFPKTGYPPTDIDSWKRIIKICKSHGLNHIRFHSWCPPKAAFTAADELGFYYQVECSSWANQGAVIGNGKPIDQWLYDEADAVLKAYGNSPSFMLFAYGNEPAGPGNGGDYLKKWVSYYKKKDTRHLVTGGSGWPMIGENEFHVTPQPRIQQWGQALKSRINSRAPETVTDYRDFVKRYPDQAVISHEIGQWCVYPNFEEIKKYTGVLKPKNFEVFCEFLENKHMADQAHDFLMASGKLQTLCYKEEIESALRTPHFGGFQLLDLHDFPGQGTALVGVLDPFWDSKPYVSPAEYKRFCGPVVPLARLPKRIFTVSDKLTAQVDVSQFGSKDLADVQLKWSLLDTSGKAVRQGTLKKEILPAGELNTLGDLSISLSDLPAPAKYNLQLTLQQTDSVNGWDVWVYPETVKITPPDDVIIATSLDEGVISRLQDGAKVLLVMDPSQVRTDVRLGFSSIFWNTAWTNGQAPHTLGILCDPEHPALSSFPTEYHSNWQWFEPIHNAAVMEMDYLPTELRPIIQVVPDWFNPKRLGLVFEAKVGKGSILLSSIDILNDLEKRPVLRQLRHSLLQYMDSDEFKPATTIDVTEIKKLFRQPSQMQILKAKIVGVDSFEPNYEPQNAIDQRPQTFWHTAWTNTKPGYPHRIQFDLGKPVTIKAMTCLPRQDGNQNGWIKAYAVYVSDTPNKWGDPIAHGTFQRDAQLKEIYFEKEIQTRYIRFEAINGFGNDVFASMAEFDVIFK